jgi:hypothetical protein
MFGYNKIKKKIAQQDENISELSIQVATLAEKSQSFFDGFDDLVSQLTLLGEKGKDWANQISMQADSIHRLAQEVNSLKKEVNQREENLIRQLSEQSEYLKRLDERISSLEDQSLQDRKEGEQRSLRFNELKLNVDNIELRLGESDSKVRKIMSNITLKQDDKVSASDPNHMLLEEYRSLRRDYDIQLVRGILNSSLKEGQVSGFQGEDRKLRKAEIESKLYSTLFCVFQSQALTSENMPKISKAIVDKLVSDLSVPESLTSITIALVEEGLQILNKVKNAKSSDGQHVPGHFETYSEGCIFDSIKHQPAIGCDEGGRILYTNYPAYMVEGMIREKAVVFTVQNSI